MNADATQFSACCERTPETGLRQPEFRNGLLVGVEEVLVPAYITNIEGAELRYWRG